MANHLYEPLCSETDQVFTVFYEMCYFFGFP